MALRPLEEVCRLKSNSNTELVVELETAEVTQAGTKGYKREGDIVFTGEIHVIAVGIYLNLSCN